jgi:hypothetical protein
LNQAPGAQPTDVAAQINFKIKLKYAQEGARAVAHEGLDTPFNFKIKLEYAGTSVKLPCVRSNQFGSKIELRGYLSQRYRRGVIWESRLMPILRKRAPVLIWYYPRPEEVKSKFFHVTALLLRPCKIDERCALFFQCP